MWIFHSGVTGYKTHRENYSHMGACNYRTEIFFFHHIRIVLKLIFFISILAKFSSHDLIFRSIIFLIVTPMPYQYHLLPFITNPFRLISQRCFSIFEQSLHFTNFRLIISVSIFFFYFHLGVGIK